MFSNIEIWPISNAKGNIKARGRVTVADVINVSVTVMNGKNGLFCGLPGRKGKDKEGKEKWYSDVFIPDKDVLADLNKQVVSAYKAKVGGDSSQGEAPGPTNQYTDNIPF